MEKFKKLITIALIMVISTMALVVVGGTVGVLIGRTSEAELEQKINDTLDEAHLTYDGWPLGIFDKNPNGTEIQKAMNLDLEAGEKLMYLTKPYILTANKYCTIYKFTGTTAEMTWIDGEKQLAKFTEDYIYAVKYKSH